MFLRSLQGRERELGPEHPETLEAADNLAAMLQDLEKYHDAKELYHRSLEAREKTLGFDHRSTYTTLWRLAALHEVQGQFLEAEQCYQRVVKRLSTTLGEDHPDFIRSLELLAELKERVPTNQEPNIIDCEAGSSTNPQVVADLVTEVAKVRSEITAKVGVNRHGSPKKLGWAIRLMQRINWRGRGR